MTHSLAGALTILALAAPAACTRAPASEPDRFFIEDFRELSFAKDASRADFSAWCDGTLGKAPAGQSLDECARAYRGGQLVMHVCIEVLRRKGIDAKASEFTRAMFDACATSYREGPNGRGYVIVPSKWDAGS